MRCDIRVLAPAKVNFALKVGQKGTDGYHSIESVFQTVSLCDTITVKETAGNGNCEVHCGKMELPNDNTAARAYRAFAEVSGLHLPSVAVSIDKKIPMGGGLGGGSSDAAAFVRALEVLTTVVLTVPQLCLIASRVGCDVYFFLLCGADGCAIVRGRGDIVKPIRTRRDLRMLLVILPFASSTPEAYRLLDERRKERMAAVPVLGDPEEVYKRPVKQWTFVNDFTLPVSERFTIIQSILGYLHNSGAAFCEMSGSGSTLYGVFDTDEGVERARLMLAERFKECRVEKVHPFGGSHEVLY